MRGPAGEEKRKISVFHARDKKKRALIQKVKIEDPDTVYCPDLSKEIPFQPPINSFKTHKRVNFMLYLQQRRKERKKVSCLKTR